MPTISIKILALIPARGGSQRLPRKNIKLLGGLPLINWSINTATKIQEICDVMVSTDDTEIAEIAQRNGALVPWLRPKNLATESSSSVDVAIHALDWYEKNRETVDGLLLLQPTSPFRSTINVERGINLFRNHNFKPVVAVKPSHSLTYSIKMDSEYLTPNLETIDLENSVFGQPKTFAVTGSFYLIAPNDLRLNRKFTDNKTVPLMDDNPTENIDIDTEWDFKLAEMILNQSKSLPLIGKQETYSQNPPSQQG